MEQAKQPDVTERIADLALAESHARALLTMRGYAAGLLSTGYPREALYQDLERAREVLERRGTPEEAEDVVPDVMDFLVGLGTARMRLRVGSNGTKRTAGAVRTGERLQHVVLGRGKGGRES